MQDLTPSFETKLRAARARLAMDKPFIGALVLPLPFASAAWCESIATDARTIYFNPRYIERLSFAQTQFVLAHEAMHCALGHFARRSHRIRNRWDIACDYAVNLLLVDEGLAPPEGALIDVRYRGMSAEEIYPLITADGGERTLDLHVFDAPAAMVAAAWKQHRSASTNGSLTQNAADSADAAYFSDDDMWSDAGSHQRRHAGDDAPTVDQAPSMEALAQAWQMRLAAAAQQAQHIGRLSASWRRVLGEVIEPVLPWRALLARYLATLARDDYSFQRPSRREGQALLPSLRSDGIELFIALDTSGSIGEEALRAFVTEIDSLKGQVRARVTLHACDEALAVDGPWTAQPWEHLVMPAALSGGGGTSFIPIFDWIAREGLRPDLLIYFTDAEGEFPAAPPVFPVLWLVKGRGVVPWGERIQLN